MNKMLAATIAISAVIWWILLSEFDPQQRFTIFFLNKSFADASVVIMGISFLIGPLCKIIPPLRKVKLVRRYFGIIGFLFGVVHIGTSLAQWSGRFPFSYYLSHWIGIVAGLFATGIFIWMTKSSTHAAFMRLGAHRWKQIQRYGYIAMVLLIVHISIAGIARWEQWWAGKVSMPNSALVAAVILFVFLIRGMSLIVDQLFPHQKALR